MNKSKFIFLFIIMPLFSFSQLTTNGGMNPTQLVQDILVGNGVTVSNVNYAGSAGAIGSFTAKESSLGIEEGIILTTGTINSGNSGPYGPNDLPNAGLDNNFGGYAPLTNIVGANTFNAAVLEFDFVPQSDSVVFTYVFGSDEYPEWVGDQFNDVFAFFISGPGIQGSQNMALIPGSNQAVAINNVNNGNNNAGPCTNCEYYVNNGTGTNAPYNSDNYYVQYDGLTKPLQAASSVQCGETYHLVIAIADVADAIFDSGIFLEANSLTSKQPINASYKLSNNPFGDNKTMQQGCTSATVTVTRSGQFLDEELTVPVSVSGTAEEGVDFSNIPNQINFAAGETQSTFVIDAFPNENFEGIVSIILEFEFLDPCGEVDSQTIEILISSVDNLDVELSSVESDCAGDEVEITATATGGAGVYSYKWNTGDTSSTIYTSPTTEQTYTVVVTDSCLTTPVEGEITVIPTIFDPLSLDLTDDIVEQCPYVPHDFEVTVSGGAGGFTYVWTDEEGKELSNENKMTDDPSSSTSYTISVEDKCGDTISGTVSVTILSPPLVVSTSSDREICPGDSVTIYASATGGFGDYYFYWPHSGETTDTITVSPNETTDYQVIVSDDCQTFQKRDAAKVVVVAPDANFQIVTTPLFNNQPITFQNLTNNGVDYQWFFGDGNTSTQVHPNNQYDEPGNYEVMLIATDEKGCIDTITKMITIIEEFFLYIPNAFTPKEPQNNVFTASTVNITSLNIMIFNRWGELIYSSDDVNFEWDGFFRGRLVRNGVYPWRISYRSVNNEEEPHELDGFITVIW